MIFSPEQFSPCFILPASHFLYFLPRHLMKRNLAPSLKSVYVLQVGMARNSRTYLQQQISPFQFTTRPQPKIFCASILFFEYVFLYTRPSYSPDVLFHSPSFIVFKEDFFPAPEVSALLLGMSCSHLSRRTRLLVYTY